MLSTSHASGTLKNARDATLKDWNYDSEGTCQTKSETMSQKLQDVFNGRIPYNWQAMEHPSFTLLLRPNRTSMTSSPHSFLPQRHHPHSAHLDLHPYSLTLPTPANR